MLTIFSIYILFYVNALSIMTNDIIWSHPNNTNMTIKVELLMQTSLMRPSVFGEFYTIAHWTVSGDVSESLIGG